MTQWSCYCIGESVCYWLEKENSMDTWWRRTHNTWRWRTTLIKSERYYWMTASLYRKYNTFSDRESEQQHRTMTLVELPNHPLLLTMARITEFEIQLWRRWRPSQLFVINNPLLITLLLYFDLIAVDKSRKGKYDKSLRIRLRLQQERNLA